MVDKTTIHETIIRDIVDVVSDCFTNFNNVAEVFFDKVTFSD